MNKFLYACCNEIRKIFIYTVSTISSYITTVLYGVHDHGAHAPHCNMHAGAYSNVHAKCSSIVSIVLAYQPTQSVHVLMSIHIKLNTYNNIIMHLH